MNGIPIPVSPGLGDGPRFPRERGDPARLRTMVRNKAMQARRTLVRLTEQEQSARALDGSREAQKAGEGGERDAGVRGGGGTSADRIPDGLDAEGRLTEEQRLAYEQWLRRIPDDPGGLRRRKFAPLEYRVRGSPPPARSDAW